MRCLWGHVLPLEAGCTARGCLQVSPPCCCCRCGAPTRTGPLFPHRPQDLDERQPAVRWRRLLLPQAAGRLPGGGGSQLSVRRVAAAARGLSRADAAAPRRSSLASCCVVAAQRILIASLCCNQGTAVRGAGVRSWTLQPSVGMPGAKNIACTTTVPLHANLWVRNF